MSKSNRKKNRQAVNQPTPTAKHDAIPAPAPVQENPAPAPVEEKPEVKKDSYKDLSDKDLKAMLDKLNAEQAARDEEKRKAEEAEAAKKRAAEEAEAKRLKAIEDAETARMERFARILAAAMATNQTSVPAPAEAEENKGGKKPEKPVDGQKATPEKDAPASDEEKGSKPVSVDGLKIREVWKFRYAARLGGTQTGYMADVFEAQQTSIDGRVKAVKAWINEDGRVVRELTSAEMADYFS